MSILKRCSKCKQQKPLSEFYKHKMTKDGYRGMCKPCGQASVTEWKRNNRDKVCADLRDYYYRTRDERNYREYYERTRAERIAYSRRYYNENRQERLAYHKKYYQKNKKQVLKQSREWVKNNPEKRREISRRYKARKRGAKKNGTHTRRQWIRLCREFDYRCVCCLEKIGIESLERDHIRPLSWGNSSDAIENIQPLCRSCNVKKLDLHDTDYRLTFHDRMASLE